MCKLSTCYSHLYDLSVLLFILLICFFPVLSNDGAEFGGSIYQKVNDKLETAVNLAWTAGSNSTRFGIAAKYQLDKDASVSVSSSRAFPGRWE